MLPTYYRLSAVGKQTYTDGQIGIRLLLLSFEPRYYYHLQIIIIYHVHFRFGNEIVLYFSNDNVQLVYVRYVRWIYPHWNHDIEF